MAEESKAFVDQAPGQVCRNISQIEELNLLLATIADDDPERDEKVSGLSDRIASLSGDVISGVLKPLTYREQRLVQSGITEAIISGADLGLDDAVRRVAAYQEEVYLTVYYSLRGPLGERLYKNLNEIVRDPFPALTELYRQYQAAFVTPIAAKKKS